MSVLEILGIVFLAVVAVSAVVALRFYWRVRPYIDSGTDHLTMHSALPALRLRLEKGCAENWLSKAQFKRYEAMLKKMEFEHTSYHVLCNGKARTQVSFWSQPKKGLMFSMMEQYRPIPGNTRAITEDDVSFSIELFVQFADGVSLTVTTNEDADLLPRPKEHILLKCAGADLNQLFAILKKKIPKSKKVQPVVDVKSVFQSIYEQCSEWVWQGEQLRSPQIHALAETLNIVLTDELIYQLQEQSSSELSELYTGRVLKKFVSRTKMSAEEWENYRERLVVVHERMPPAEIAHCVYELVSQIPEELEKELDSFSEQSTVNQPIQTFHGFLKKANAGKSITRVVKMDKPISSEIYLA